MKKILLFLFILFLLSPAGLCNNSTGTFLNQEETLEIENAKKEMDEEANLFTKTKIDNIKPVNYTDNTKKAKKQKKNKKVKTAKIKEKTKNIKTAINEIVDTPPTPNETLEEKKNTAIKEMQPYIDKDYDSAKEVWKEKKAEAKKQEKEMEVIGKTFWTRKPIHPIAKYGYKDELPDIDFEMEYKKPNNTYKNMTELNSDVPKEKLVPTPRSEQAYVDIIIKKNKSSEYVNDVNDVLAILQKLSYTIENGADVQYFNAQISNLMDNVFYIQDKYRDKAESYYVSYYKMAELANFARTVAELRTEARTYNKYLAYSGEGSIYRPENIQKQINKLLKLIQETMIILKETR